MDTGTVVGSACPEVEVLAKPILALGRLAFDEDEGKVIYPCGDCDTARVGIGAKGVTPI
jgi:hypothetical protein